MPFKIEERLLDGIVVLRPARYDDARGWFSEVFRADQFAALGLPAHFAQDNHSRSTYGVVRGMHFQHTPPMGKLLRVVRGAIQLVEVDLRRRSPTFGQHIELEVSDVNGRIVWIPPGFANGFCVLSDVADVVYKCTAIYNADGEASLNPLDAKLGIHWMADRLVLSERDRNAPGLLELEPFFE